MSKYTTQVRFICENAAGLPESVGYSQVDSVIEQAAPRVLDFDFPAFDDAHRESLKRKILLHYYTREIGFETVGLWKLNMQRKLNEIMPPYVELLQSKAKLAEIDYFNDVSLTVTKDGSHADDESGSNNTTTNMSQVSGSTNTTTGTNKDTRKYSKTPQGSLTNVETGTYLTEAEINDGTGNSTSTDNSHITGDTDTAGSHSVDRSGTYHESVSTTGKAGSAPYMDYVKKWRDLIVNVDLQIIDDLADLFMTIW